MGKKSNSKDKTEVKQLSPFDIIKMMFTDKEQFDSLSSLMLEKNFFIVNRMFAIKYPFQANCFNLLKTNRAEAMKSWEIFMLQHERHGSVPYFIYTKGSKRSSEAKEKKSQFAKPNLEEYAKHYNMSKKDIQDLIEFDPEDLKKELARFSKMMNPTISSTKPKK